MSTSHSVEQEALAGRLPVLSGNRVYKTYGSFLWTCCAFSAATWAFLIGSYLPYVGDWRLGVMGYVIGLIIGMALVSLASGVPSYKYGTDPIDTAKASFGYRGIIVPLFGLLATLIGWSYVVEALTARGAANVAATVTGSQVTGDSHEHLVIGVALATLFLVWFIACKGPKFFERLNGFIGPLHMLITLVMFGILVHKFGLENLWHNQVAPDQMLSHDPVQGLALAVEFGVSNAMTWWPVMGGLTRLVKSKNHVMGPSIIGVGILGAAVVSTVAALAAISAGTYDPTIWMIAVGGPVFGSIVMTIVLTANVATMVVMIYLAGVSIQQVKFFARLKWELLLALLLLPGVYFAFETEWLLSKVMSWLSYNGVMFVGISGITLVDYFILRREQLDAPSLFATRNSNYAYWGGVNWTAVVISIVAVIGYLALYDPVTVAMHQWFRYLGASIPVIAISGASYYLAVRLIVAPMGKGNYTKGTAITSRPTLDPQPAPGAMKVSL
ncbi:cytosine permease [Pseudomonas sp. RIT288]|jgi:purine-cytosine permease-like protein|uniref:cytosine permease n=1 Tax=Pseudomonas sp. RIT288 TaxID=1470589 RepID=UPI0004535690|nr:cytosine permease [Pseudomonas sp. RIT288]EZP26612.1 cytosine/purines uracil thiamine allantoin permease [Pseudomonas sp. RIT288]